MATPILDLSTVNPAVEIIVRAGNIRVPQALATMQTNYKAQDLKYPDVIGLSVVFHQGEDYVALAQHNSFRHAKLSYATIGTIINALQSVGCGMLLYITPDPPLLPDHHTLAITAGGIVQPELGTMAGQALINVLTMVDNPYQRP